MLQRISDSAILEVDNLTTRFFTGSSVIHAVNGVSFKLRKNRCLALIGESGAGKSVTAMSLLRMVPRPGRIIGGSIRMNGKDLLKIPGSQMRRLRGEELSIMFQDPLAALNPVITIGRQIKETILSHRSMSSKEALDLTLEKLTKYKLPPRRVYDSYPFQLSGGMRQRAALALAMVLHPQVLIADEPTSFLDVTLQGQILAELKSELENCCLSLLFITHDLSAAAMVAHRVAVMYGGIIVEEGSLNQVFDSPLHPYTRALLSSHPAFCQGGRLESIPGSAPVVTEEFNGCPFRLRCKYSLPLCKDIVPSLLHQVDDRYVACHNLISSSEENQERSCF